MKWDLSAISLFALLALALLALGAALIACGPAEPMEEPAPKPDFIGKWADDSHPGLTVILEFEPNHTFYFRLRDSLGILSSASGTWHQEGQNLSLHDQVCQEGRPLNLVLCDADPYLFRIAIYADVWPLAMESEGEITRFEFRRVL